MSERSVAMAHTVADSRTVRLIIPAKPEYITLSRLALTGLARVRELPDDTLADLKLALTEACSNSVRHAYGDGDGHVEISFELCEDKLIVEVSDDGTGFDSAVSDGTGSGREFGTSEAGTAGRAAISPRVASGSRSSGRSQTSSRSAPGRTAAAHGFAS